MFNSIFNIFSEFENSNIIIQLIAFVLIFSAAIIGGVCAIIWEISIAIIGGIFYALLKG